MNDQSNRPGADPDAPQPAPEGKLIQIGGRQFRRQQVRALKLQHQQDHMHAVQLAPEAPLPQAYDEPAPPELPPAEDQMRRQRKRRRPLLPLITSFLILAVLPSIVGIAYYGVIATNQYVAEAQFAIRAQSQPTGDGASSSLLGNPLANIGETQIVAEFLHSDQLLKEIEDDVDIRALYSVEKADWWARLDPTVSREKLLKYWKWMCSVALDPVTGIVTMQIRGFAPEDAKRISEAALKESEKLVNRLSERARNDAMAVANAEVGKAKDRVDQTLENLKQFQISKQYLDPEAVKDASSKRLEELESRLTEYETELASLSQVMAPNAPSIIGLKRNIAATQAQITAERGKATAKNDKADVPVLTAEYNKLTLEKEFAEKAYVSALESLELARVEAGRQVKYLEAFVRPRLPEASLYPNRPIMILLVVGLSIFAWLMTLLIVATVKEHL